MDTGRTQEDITGVEAADTEVTLETVTEAAMERITAVTPQEEAMEAVERITATRHLRMDHRAMETITGEAVSVETAIVEAMETDILQAPVLVTMA